MIASIMYAVIGFLVASLGALVVMPLVHNRAVRLTSKRLKTTLPPSMAEIHAGRDQLRAEFAVSTRRLETKIEDLRNKSANYFVKLSTKDSIIEKLEVERDAQETENAALKAQIEALAVRSNQVLDQLKNTSESYLSELGSKGIVIEKLKIERNALQAENAALRALTAGANKVKAEGGVDAEVPRNRPNVEPTMVPADAVYGLTPGAHDHHGVAVSFVQNVWPMAELFQVPKESPPANDRRRRGDTAPPVAGGSPSTEAAVDVPKDARRLQPPNDQGDEGSIASLVPSEGLGAETVKPPTDGAHGPSPDDPQHRNDAGPALPTETPAPETVDAPADGSQPPPPNDQRVASLVASQGPTVKPVEAPTDGAHEPSPNNQQYRSDAVSHLLMRLKADEGRSGNLRREPAARRGSSDGRIGDAGGRFAFSDGSNTVVPPIRISASDGFAGNRRLRKRPGLTRVAAAIPIVAGASLAWHYYGQEATEMIKTRIPSLDRLSSLLTTQWFPDLEFPPGRTRPFRADQMSAQNAASQPMPQTAPAPAAAAASPEEARREMQAFMRDLASLRDGVEQLTAKQEEMARNIATREVAEPPVKRTMSFPRQQSREQLMAAPETRPTTIAGWTLLEVTGDAVVLKGPNGIWTARRGDLVPGVGTVDSVVRWGNRWLVATSRGLISTP